MFTYQLKRKIFIHEEAFVGAGDITSTTDRGSAGVAPGGKGAGRAPPHTSRSHSSLAAEGHVITYFIQCVFHWFLLAT